MVTTAVKRRPKANGKKPNGKHSGLPKLPGSPKGQIPDKGLQWLTCVTCQDLVPVQDRSVSGRLNVMMNDAGNIYLGLDISFICRYCKWEQAQNGIIERLVSVEKLGIKLTEESAMRNDRLDRMEESNGD